VRVPEVFEVSAVIVIPALTGSNHFEDTTELKESMHGANFVCKDLSKRAPNTLARAQKRQPKTFPSLKTLSKIVEKDFGWRFETQVKYLLRFLGPSK